MNSDGLFDRSAVIAEFDQAGRELRSLLQSFSEQDLRRRSDGTRWTNEQLLFHMVFGYMIVQALLGLVRAISYLPAGVGRGFARMLDALTGPFDAVNYWGSCAAATFYNHARMQRKFDRVAAALLRRLERETEESLARGMNFPTRWDPFFAPFMTIADLYHYPVKHFLFHAGQLSKASTPAA